MTRRFGIHLVALCALLSASVGAQCASLIATPYGASCGNAFPGATLSASIDPLACSGTLTLSSFPGCCNTYAVGTLWSFGTQQTQTPIPGISNCFLLTSNEVLLMGAGSETTLTFPAPVALAGLTVHAQAATLYFTTIGLTNEITLSHGLTLIFQ